MSEDYRIFRTSAHTLGPALPPNLPDGTAMPRRDRRALIGSMPRMVVSSFPGRQPTTQEVLNDRGLRGDPRA